MTINIVEILPADISVQHLAESKYLLEYLPVLNSIYNTGEITHPVKKLSYSIFAKQRKINSPATPKTKTFPIFVYFF